MKGGAAISAGLPQCRLNPTYLGDLAIDGDTISALGSVDEPGKREIDAEGAVVTPGFINVIDMRSRSASHSGWRTFRAAHRGSYSAPSATGRRS